MSAALVELRDRMVARCALISERHENPIESPVIVPEHLSRYVDPIITSWKTNAPAWRAPEVVGCSRDEIREIEHAQGVVVPDAYREFLGLMGRFAADLDAGTEWLYPDVVDLKQSAVELLAEWQNPFALRPGALVVAMHQGYQFTWLDTNDGPDPAVWHWIESTPRPTQPEDSGWIEYLLRQESYLRDP
jgi:hypothetical protein